MLTEQHSKVQGIDCLNTWSWGWLGAPALCPALHYKTMVSLGKVQNSELKVLFYLMHVAFTPS
jgi:hypothetical protein